MKKEVIAHKNPKSPISEIFRTLRTNIQFMNVNKKMKALVVTSTFPGEGKSWVASNLAVTFAQAGKKVVLIDADMRKGRQYAIFGVSPIPGLSNFLSQAEINQEGRLTEDAGNYIQTTEVENLYVMPAGNVPPNPSELLVSAQMIGLLNSLKEAFDFVIIDGTPSELVTDSVILSRIADSTLIVTAHKVTKKDALERVVKNIQNVGGKIAGVVINRVPVSAKAYGEKYYYYGEDRILSAKSKKSIWNNKKRKEKSNLNFNEVAVKYSGEADNNVEATKQTESEYENTENITNTKNTENVESTEKWYAIETKNSEQNGQAKEVPLDKTNDILKQINDYLDNEKKSL